MSWTATTWAFVFGFWAMVATAAAAIAGFLAAHRQRENNALEQRNGDLQAQLVAIEERRDVRSVEGRRAAVATAVLFDLDTMEPNLRRMHESETAWGESFIPRDAGLEAFIDHVDLFRPETVHTVLQIRGLVYDLRHEMPSGTIDRRLDNPHRTWYMRSLAGFMVLAIHEARAELVREGGALVPAARDYRDLEEPELPQLPPSPAHLRERRQLTFDIARADDEATPAMRLLRAAEASERDDSPT